MNLLGGLFRLARFRKDGFEAFANTSQAVLNSLAPLLAFPLVGGVIGMLGGQGLAAGIDLLATIIALLAPLVITHAFAKAWGKLAVWPRFAAASNWCQWVLPVIALVLVFTVMLLDAFGLALRPLIMAALFAIVAYGVALHWFLARTGLGLSWLRAVVMVVVTDLGTGALVMLPRLLAGSA